jgi:mycothiol synthase
LDAIRQKADQIAMIRRGFGGLPALGAPAGYTLRSFRPGDEKAWADLLAAAFPETHEPWLLPRKEFMGSPIWRPERIWFACKDGVPVGSTAAWEQPTIWGPRSGIVHWVATHPAHQRRGLARATVTAALSWMNGQGYEDSILVTQVYRLPAIRLYLSLGFRAHLAAFPEMPGRWAKVEADLRAGHG